MGKLMLNVGTQPNTHTHALMKLNRAESNLQLHLATHTPNNPHKAQQHTYQTDDQTQP